ncbi:MAG: AAA family ATPase [Alkalispirochaeta sp.]
MPDPIYDALSNPGAQALRQWRDAIVGASPETPLDELGVTGLLLSRQLFGSGDPVLAQLVERVVRATQEAMYGVQYTTRAQLLRDIDALLDYEPIPGSREDVFRRFTEHLHNARGGAPTPLVVSGESGIGKTFLWESFQRMNARADEAWIYYKSPQIGESPYGAYTEVLDQLISRTAEVSGMDASEVARRLTRDEGVSGTAARVIATLIGDRYSNISAVGSPEEVATGAAAPALAAALRIVATWARSAGVGAVLLALDDLQWTDFQSLDVWGSLSLQTEAVAPVFMARPGLIESTPAFQSAASVRVGSLTDRESRVLARALVVPATDDDPSVFRAISPDETHGNPFIIAQSAREIHQIRGLGVSQQRPFNHVESETTIRRQLREMSPAAQAVIENVALLLPPVRRTTIARALQVSSEELSSALRECREAGVLAVRGDAIVFSHDRLETAARSAALHSARWTTTAGRVLVERATDGDLRATYVLARLISDSGGATVRAGVTAPTGATPEAASLPVGTILSAAECVAILQAAAARAVELAIAGDAAQFAAVALENYGPHCSAPQRLSLLHLGHRAAFLQDDGGGMSHYFRYLAAHGQSRDLIDARQLWISRCYSKLWIRGALRIGKNILREFGATEGLSVGQARSILRRWEPVGVFRRIVAQSEDTDPDSLRISRTCAEMILPVMSIDPDAPYLLAVVILRRSLAYGRTPYTSFGFLYWAMAMLLDSQSNRRRNHALACAGDALERAPLDAVSAVEANRIRVFVGIISLPWRRLRPRNYGRLFHLYQEGMACGSFETAAHAIHVYCYAPLFHGYPLEEVSTTIEYYRRGVESRGLKRISRAMGKFAQAALVLMGDTPDPLAVTGHICTETELEAQLQSTGDTLGLAGLGFLRALLAAFHGAPELALNRLRAVDHASKLVEFLVDPTWAWFLHAMFAWRLGIPREAREFGRRLREVSDSTPGNHRYAAVRAERLLRAGMKRSADRTFRYATELAIFNGHIHDAAFISERHAEVLFRRSPTTPKAIERLRVAEGLYTQWGAGRKVAEIRSRIAEFRRTTGQLLEGLVRAGELPRPQQETGEHDPQEQLTEARAALTHTREYAHLLFSYVEEALLLVREDGTVLFHNGAAAPLVVAEASDSWRLESEFVQLIGGCSRDGEGEIEWRRRILTYAMRLVPRQDGPTAVALVVRDVTQARNRERQLLVADRLSSLGMLAATVAHEVGNPNHIIALHAQSLAMTTETPATREAVSNILEGSERINEAVGLITRYGREGTETSARWGDPVEIGTRVERFTRIMARQYTAHLEFVHEQGVPAFWGYPALVEQALVNLVKNACEALTHRDQIVRIRVTYHGEAVLFQVCDQGAGFASQLSVNSEPRPTVFATTKAESGGSGLGISIVRSIADRHGGALRYTGDEQFTTIAELRIPVNSA